MPMSLEVELGLFGHDVPFIKERYYTAFLPEDERGGGKRIKDGWDVLAVLIERNNDSAWIRVIRQGDEDFIQVKIYDGGYGRCELTKTHLIPIPAGIVNRLVSQGLIEGVALRNDCVDDSERKISHHGMETLVRHIETIVR